MSLAMQPLCNGIQGYICDQTCYGDPYAEFKPNPNHGHKCYLFLSFPQVPRKLSGRKAKA